MIIRTTVLIGILLSAAAASAATLVNPIVLRPVPAIPHGLDWNIFVVPTPEIIVPVISEDEIKNIVPRVIELGRIEGALAFGPPPLHHNSASVGPFVAMIAGTALLLAAYEFIPRVHSRVLRFRSVNLNRDLFS